MVLCVQESLSSILPDWIGGKDIEADGHCLFCPECELQGQWFSDVCPGCFEYYPDCELSKSFAYKYKRTITQDHLVIIREGTCPFRTNGTFGYEDGLITSINLSEQAPGAVVMLLLIILRNIARSTEIDY